MPRFVYCANRLRSSIFCSSVSSILSLDSTDDQIHEVVCFVRLRREKLLEYFLVTRLKQVTADDILSLGHLAFNLTQLNASTTPIARSKKQEMYNAIICATCGSSSSGIRQAGKNFEKVFFLFHNEQNQREELSAGSTQILLLKCNNLEVKASRVW